MSSLAYKLLAFAVLCCGLAVYAAEKPTEEKKVVKVLKVATSEIYDLYKYPVVIEPKYERELYAEITGFVADIYVKVGALVKKDAVVMQLKPTGPGFTEQALTIKSPLDGEITEVAKKIGSHIKPGDLLMHIVEPNDLTIKIEIPQAELDLLPVGQQGEAQFRILAVALPVVVSGVASWLDQATGTATGQLDWDVQNFKGDESQLINKHIYPGMLGYVTFKLNKRMGIKIPSQAILHEKSEDKIRLVVDGKACKKSIKLGKHLDNGLIEVMSGLKADDMIVISASKYIKDNEEVTIKEEK